MARSSFNISSLICCCVSGAGAVWAGACAQVVAVSSANAAGAASRRESVITGQNIPKPGQRHWTNRINACRLVDMQSASLFRLLGDEARLRILRLLDSERLNVTELTSILGIAQSGVSRHLGLLKDAGLVEEPRAAGFTFFRLAPNLQSGENGSRPVCPLPRSDLDPRRATPGRRAGR